LHLFQSLVYAAVGMNHIIDLLEDDSSTSLGVTELSNSNLQDVSQDTVKKFKNTQKNSFLNPEIH
jgi:hypothetical protein